MKARGIVPFDLAGEGLVLQFPNSALLKLEEHYGEGVTWEKVELGLMNGSIKTTALCIEHALRREVAGRLEPVNMALDDWPFTVRDAAFPLMDALALSYYGKTYTEVLEEQHEQRAAVEMAIAKEQMERGEQDDDPLLESPEPAAS